MNLQEKGLQQVLTEVTVLLDDFVTYTSRACNLSLELSSANLTQWLHQRMEAAAGVDMRKSGPLNQLVHLITPEPQYKFIQLSELETIDTRGGSITRVSNTVESSVYVVAGTTVSGYRYYPRTET